MLLSNSCVQGPGFSTFSYCLLAAGCMEFFGAMHIFCCRQVSGVMYIKC